MADHQLALVAGSSSGCIEHHQDAPHRDPCAAEARCALAMLGVGLHHGSHPRAVARVVLSAGRSSNDLRCPQRFANVAFDRAVRTALAMDQW
jgi:hypothetical protein